MLLQPDLSARLTDSIVARFDSPLSESVLPDKHRAEFMWLEADVARLSLQAAALSGLGLGTPCLLVDDEPWPCDLVSVERDSKDWIQLALESGELSEHRFRTELAREAELADRLGNDGSHAQALMEVWRQHASVSQLAFLNISFEETAKAVRSRINLFFSAYEGSSITPPPIPPTGRGATPEGKRPMVPFAVDTTTGGHRVHFAPSDLCREDWIFGEPTTPVDGFLTSGWWKFGVWRENQSAVQWDPGRWEVPRHVRARLTIA